MQTQYRKVALISQNRTVESVQIKKYGPILILLEEFSPFALDESEVLGDLTTFKPGDSLEKCGDKYIKVRRILQ